MPYRRTLGLVLARLRGEAGDARLRAAGGADPLRALLLCGKTLADYPQDVGDGRDIRTWCDRPVTRPLRIYGVGGHMHLRGVDIRRSTPARARTLLHIPRWEFHWQDAYYLQEPVDAEPGDTIRVTCRFDNPPAAQPVVRGGR